MHSPTSLQARLRISQNCRAMCTNKGGHRDALLNKRQGGLFFLSYLSEHKITAGHRPFSVHFNWMATQAPSWLVIVSRQNLSRYRYLLSILAGGCPSGGSYTPDTRCLVYFFVSKTS